MMISPPSSPTFTPSIPTSGELHTENENGPLSPKRSFAQLDEDPLSQPEFKRRDVQPSGRVPLVPLSASRLENRLGPAPHSTDVASHLDLVIPCSATDLRILHPVQPASPGVQRSDVSVALVCAWPPPHPAPSTGRSSHSGQAGQQHDPLHCPSEKLSSRAAFPEPTSTRDLSTSFSAEPTTTMNKPVPTSGWKSENILQPIRSRTNSMPSVRRPPNELWRSDSPPTQANPAPIDSSVHFAPPGLPPRRSVLRRSGSTSDLLPHGSVSLSLALGSQPLGASEHTKTVPPIGAERNRVISITSLKAQSQHSPTPLSHDHSKSPWCSSPHPPLQAKWANETYFSNDESLKKVQATIGDASKEDLERLLLNAVRNKYAPKVVSPLSPLRTSIPAPRLSADPEFQLRMPSRFNTPSPRYSYCPPRRARTVCDGFQSFDWNATCMHCQECKQDSIGKRLLAFRYRQQQTRHAQRGRLLVFPSRGATVSVADDDRTVLANCIRDVFAYEMDEEEKNLWQEVAAVTGTGYVPFSRAGAPCAIAAAHRRGVDGNSDGTHDELFEISDDGLLAKESATLFREVSVY